MKSRSRKKNSTDVSRSYGERCRCAGREQSSFRGALRKVGVAFELHVYERGKTVLVWHPTIDSFNLATGVQIGYISMALNAESASCWERRRPCLLATQHELLSHRISMITADVREISRRGRLRSQHQQRG
jgi:hypothetical protein